MCQNQVKNVLCQELQSHTIEFSQPSRALITAQKVVAIGISRTNIKRYIPQDYLCMYRKGDVNAIVNRQIKSKLHQVCKYNINLALKCNHLYVFVYTAKHTNAVEARTLPVL